MLSFMGLLSRIITFFELEGNRVSNLISYRIQKFHYRILE